MEELKRIRERLAERKNIHIRKDADDDGRWITTENGHHVHINAEGEPDKGNPHVVDKMTKQSEYKKLDKPHYITNPFGHRMESYGEGNVKDKLGKYHVYATDKYGGKFADSGNIGGINIKREVDLQDGGKGIIVSAHIYPNGKYDFNVEVKPKYSYMKPERVQMSPERILKPDSKRYTSNEKGYESLVDDAMKKNPEDRYEFFKKNSPFNGEPKSIKDVYSTSMKKSQDDRISDMEDAVYDSKPGSVIEVETGGRAGGTGRYIKTSRETYVTEGNIANMLRGQMPRNRYKDSCRDVYNEIRYLIENGRVSSIKVKEY